METKKELKKYAKECLETSLKTGEPIPEEIADQLCQDLGIKRIGDRFECQTGSLHNPRFKNSGWSFKSLEMALWYKITGVVK